MKSKKVLNIFKDVEYNLKSARVISVSATGTVLEILGHPQVAGKAFSCTICPEVGDLVLYAQASEGSLCILSIIDRPDSQNMTLSFPANVNINADNGAFGLKSKESISLVAGEQLNCFSKETIYKSNEAIIDIEKITAKGESFLAVFKSMNIISQIVTRLTKRLMEKTQSYIRRSEDYDEVSAGQMTRKTKDLYSIKSKNTIMISENETVIDGKHIFTGL